MTPTPDDHPHRRQPGPWPDGARPAWHADAACAGTNAHDWFPPRGDRSGIPRLIAICTGCPVRTECLDHALEHEHHGGVWGGLTDRGRRAIRRAQRAADDDARDDREVS